MAGKTKYDETKEKEKLVLKKEKESIEEEKKKLVSELDNLKSQITSLNEELSNYLNSFFSFFFCYSTQNAFNKYVSLIIESVQNKHNETNDLLATAYRELEEKRSTVDTLKKQLESASSSAKDEGKLKLEVNINLSSSTEVVFSNIEYTFLSGPSPAFREKEEISRAGEESARYGGENQEVREISASQKGTDTELGKRGNKAQYVFNMSSQLQL